MEGKMAPLLPSQAKEGPGVHCLGRGLRSRLEGGMAPSLTCSMTSRSHLSWARPGAHLFPRATGTSLSSLANPNYQMGKTPKQIKLLKISFLVGAEEDTVETGQMG